MLKTAISLSRKHYKEKTPQNTEIQQILAGIELPPMSARYSSFDVYTDILEPLFEKAAQTPSNIT